MLSIISYGGLGVLLLLGMLGGVLLFIAGLIKKQTSFIIIGAAITAISIFLNGFLGARWGM